jgi:hypothetical protein
MSDWTRTLCLVRPRKWQARCWSIGEAVRRYLVKLGVEPSPEVLSALSAASVMMLDGEGDPGNLTVELTPDNGAVSRLLDALAPPQDNGVLTVAVNAPDGGQATTKVREALRRWGEIEAEVIGDERL